MHAEDSLLLSYIVLICNFHREQALERWLVKKFHGCSEKRELTLPKMRRIARPISAEDMQRAIKALKSSEYWTDSKYNLFQEYFSNYCLLSSSSSRGFLHESNNDTNKFSEFALAQGVTEKGQIVTNLKEVLLWGAEEPPVNPVYLINRKQKQQRYCSRCSTLEHYMNFSLKN